MIATSDKILAERRGSQSLDSELDVSCIGNTSGTSRSCTPCCMPSLSPMISPTPTSDINNTDNASLVARIQFLEAENAAHQKLARTGKAVELSILHTIIH